MWRCNEGTTVTDNPADEPIRPPAQEPPPFLGDYLLLDAEAGQNRLYRIGAILSGRTFKTKEKVTAPDSLRALDQFARDALGVLGHNILDHDLPILASLWPGLKLLNKPVIDTLFLSPWLFPKILITGCSGFPALLTQTAPKCLLNAAPFQVIS
jgi:hypothetical protein